MTEDQASKDTRNQLPSVFYNTLSIVGGGLAALSLGLIVFLTVLEALAEEHRPYMGIIAFIILPIFLLAGVALFIIGALVTACSFVTFAVTFSTQAESEARAATASALALRRGQLEIVTG